MIESPRNKAARADVLKELEKVLSEATTIGTNGTFGVRVHVSNGTILEIESQSQRKRRSKSTEPTDS